MGHSLSVELSEKWIGKHPDRKCSCGKSETPAQSRLSVLIALLREKALASRLVTTFDRERAAKKLHSLCREEVCYRVPYSGGDRGLFFPHRKKKKKKKGPTLKCCCVMC